MCVTSMAPSLGTSLKGSSFQVQKSRILEGMRGIQELKYDRRVSIIEDQLLRRST